MPPSPAQTVRRQRVTATLEEALTSHPLVVLTSPMGHGKSTAARELLRRWKTRSFYLRMKPGWQDNAEFLWDEACEKIAEQAGLAPGSLKLLGYPNDDARLYRALVYCREYLSREPVLLVIDDFHLAETPALNRFFESLVCEEIPGFNLLILSRAKPALPLEYLQLKGYAAVLNSDFLAFSRDEARQLFDLAGEHNHELADTARDFSHGWAAALRVCLQSYLTDKVIKPVRNIEELLSETFFASYSREDQCLLLQLSLLDTFSAAQAVFLTGEKEAPLRLRKLHEHNAFLLYSPADDAYSIHSLLRSYLLKRLGENAAPVCPELDVPLLHRRAAESSLQSGNYLQAMRLLAQAGEHEDLLRILRMFETPGEGLFILLDPEAVIGIIESIPWDIRLLSPIGYLGFVHRYMVRVSKDEAGAMMREAESRFLEEGALPEEMQRKVRGEIELVRAVLSFNDIDAIARCYEKADTLLQGSSSLVNKNMFWTYNCPHSAFLYLKKPGGYPELEALASEMLPHFRNLSDGSNSGAPELLSSERLLETGEALKAGHILNKGRYKTRESGQYSAILAAEFTAARLQLADGRADGVYDAFDALREPVEQQAHPLLLQNLELCLGYIASVCNDVERIPSWLLQHEPLKIRNNQAHAFSLMVRGKSIMALKNWPRLEAFAEQIERQTAPLESLFCRLHILLFKAVAALHTHRNSTTFAERHLLEALDLARPDGIITSIAEYGGHLYPLLQRLSNFHPEMRALVPLTRLTKKYSRLSKKRALKLTLHEMDIMEMISAGDSNKDIGAKLGITQGSVANRMSRIYAKLGVGSRIEAINKWAEESGMNMGG